MHIAVKEFRILVVNQIYLLLLILKIILEVTNSFYIPEKIIKINEEDGKVVQAIRDYNDLKTVLKRDLLPLNRANTLDLEVIFVSRRAMDPKSLRVIKDYMAFLKICALFDNI